MLDFSYSLGITYKDRLGFMRAKLQKFIGHSGPDIRKTVVYSLECSA